MSTSLIQQTHCQFGSKPISIKCQFPQQSWCRTKYQWVGHDNNSPIRDKYTNPMPIWPIQYHILATYQPQVQIKLSIIDRSANPPPIHIQSQYRLMQVSNVRIHWTHWPLALAGIGAGLVVDCQISIKVLISLTLTWICSRMPWTLSICANGFAALGTSATKKRENVGILKKKNGGGESTQIPLLL